MKNKITLLIMALILIISGCGHTKPINNTPKAMTDSTYLILINKKHGLNPAYKPNDLVPVRVPFFRDISEDSKLLRKEAAHALEKLFKEAQKLKGLKFISRTGYRSYQRQQDLWTSNIKEKGINEASKVVAKPGYSEHQTGIAVDVTSKAVQKNLVRQFESTPEGKWLVTNAHNYGFIIRYPKDREKDTGYIYEPWHIRYVGVENAKNIYNKKIILEEYVVQSGRTRQ